MHIYQVPGSSVNDHLQRHYGVHVWLLLWSNTTHQVVTEEDLGRFHWWCHFHCGVRSNCEYGAALVLLFLLSCSVPSTYEYRAALVLLFLVVFSDYLLMPIQSRE